MCSNLCFATPCCSWLCIITAWHLLDLRRSIMHAGTLIDSLFHSKQAHLFAALWFWIAASVAEVQPALGCRTAHNWELVCAAGARTAAAAARTPLQASTALEREILRMAVGGGRYSHAHACLDTKSVTKASCLTPCSAVCKSRATNMSSCRPSAVCTAALTASCSIHLAPSLKGSPCLLSSSCVVSWTRA